MTRTHLFAAACAPLLITFSLAASAEPVPPSLAEELPVCEKQHGTAPKLPVATDFQGGLSPKGSGLTPAEMPGVRTVNPKVVACLIEAMGSELVVFAPIKDEMGIPDALAWSGVGMTREPNAEEKATLERVFEMSTGGRKDRPIVVYCHSTECFLSWNALIHMKNAGYRNLLWMREGIQGWKEAGLPVGYVRPHGGRSLPDVKIPAAKWDLLGMTNYPTPPKRYDRERWKTFRATTGQRMDAICLALNSDMKAKQPAPQSVEYEHEARLYKAAGVDPNVDNEVVTRRKMQALWAKWGDHLECAELALGYRSIFKFAVNNDKVEFVERAIDRWKLPAEVFNRVDPVDGRTLLDFVEVKNQDVVKPYGLENLYRRLRGIGAKTRAELEREGTIKPPHLLQAEVLQQYRQLAEAGDIEAMFHLSLVYRRGDHVAVNRDEGMKWWHRAGERAIATNDLGSMNFIATSHFFAEPDKEPWQVPKDWARAGEFIRHAGKADTKQTNFWMGRMYLHEIGVPRDLRRAVTYLERALEQGNDESTKWLIEAYIDLGDKQKAAYYMRSWPLTQTIKGRPNAEWFGILGVKFCGQRSKLQPIVCDGTNDKPPALF